MAKKLKTVKESKAVARAEQPEKDASLRWEPTPLDVGPGVELRFRRGEMSCGPQKMTLAQIDAFKPIADILTRRSADKALG